MYCAAAAFIPVFLVAESPRLVGCFMIFTWLEANTLAISRLESVEASSISNSSKSVND
jgi:hypothetical protein